MSTSKYLHLYTDSKDVAPKFIIDASAVNVSFNASTEFRFEKDVSIKSGAASYINVNTKFGSLDTYNTDFYQQYQGDLKVDRDKSLLEISDRKAADATLTSNLASELVNARAAELILRTDLASEVVNARAAELVLRTDLASELVNARAAELVLRADLASELVNARAAELVLRTDLATETSRATGAENTEQTARAARDVLLSNKVNTEFADLYNRMLYLESVVADVIEKRSDMCRCSSSS
jgi:hypothetical protein